MLQHGKSYKPTSKLAGSETNAPAHRIQLSSSLLLISTPTRAGEGSVINVISTGIRQPSEPIFTREVV